eukprot:8323-Heterococcus_DN1.PRE.2
MGRAWRLMYSVQHLEAIESTKTRAAEYIFTALTTLHLASHRCKAGTPGTFSARARIAVLSLGGRRDSAKSCLAHLAPALCRASPRCTALTESKSLCVITRLSCLQELTELAVTAVALSDLRMRVLANASQPQAARAVPTLEPPRLDHAVPVEAAGTSKLHPKQFLQQQTCVQKIYDRLRSSCSHTASWYCVHCICWSLLVIVATTTGDTVAASSEELYWSQAGLCGYDSDAGFTGGASADQTTHSGNVTGGLPVTTDVNGATERHMFVIAGQSSTHHYPISGNRALQTCMQ